MGGLAVWAGSEAVLPAYIIGMVLAGTVGKDHVLVRRLRTLTFGLLTPFYFIRAGSFVSVPALLAAPMVFVVLFFSKMFSKMVGLVPTVRAFKYQREEGLYYTLMMSTGLTFGTISALFGLNHNIITQAQYSLLVATVIGSAVVPTDDRERLLHAAAFVAAGGKSGGDDGCNAGPAALDRRLGGIGKIPSPQRTRRTQRKNSFFCSWPLRPSRPLRVTGSCRMP